MKSDNPNNGLGTQTMLVEVLSRREYCKQSLVNNCFSVYDIFENNFKYFKIIKLTKSSLPLYLKSDSNTTSTSLASYSNIYNFAFISKITIAYSCSIPMVWLFLHNTISDVGLMGGQKNLVLEEKIHSNRVFNDFLHHQILSRQDFSILHKNRSR